MPNYNNNNPFKYDVIIVGGGHAGVEASYTCSQFKLKTLLITQNIETIGIMSCNPSLGGIGKSHLISEIDALGGLMAEIGDKSAIQVRVLNQKKGPAVQATRIQADRNLYRQGIRQVVENQPNLHLFQQSVKSLQIDKNKITGVTTQSGVELSALAVILTTGTFLEGKIHLGKESYSGGRAGDSASPYLSDQLNELLGKRIRLKTGTPPRIHRASINLKSCEEQLSETPLKNLSVVHSFGGVGFSPINPQPKQIPCYITHTNTQTHTIINQSLHQSALFGGKIKSVGPRYCPSIEDKVVRFKDKERHQIFLEPEGLNSQEIYPNGLSTSLPFKEQLLMLRSIKGLENAHITRAGYAIEYDCFNPQNLKKTLETKAIEGLFLAGQINGTTGYEEAASQGVLVGYNASLKILNQSPLILERSQSYLGVLVDDLVQNGVNEPYRMFTSRSEFRLSLREDNADLRLTSLALKLGVINEKREKILRFKQENVVKMVENLKKCKTTPAKINLSEGFKKTSFSFFELLKRPSTNYQTICDFHQKHPNYEKLGFNHPLLVKQVEVEALYEGYLKRQKNDIGQLEKYQNFKLSKEFVYDNLEGLSIELKQKLKENQPTSIAQAQKISGMTPAALSLIIAHLKNKPQTKSKPSYISNS